MASNFYEVDNAELTPSSVQPLSRGAGKKIDPIEFNLNEHTDANERLNIWEDICIRADEFRLWLATRCCACLSSVPSFALVIIAAVLIMLLIATIPLAFALTYISPQASTAEDSSRGNGINILFPDRYHSTFPNDSELIKYRDWDDDISLKTSLLLPKNITSCSIYGFACTGKPHIVIPKNRRCDGYPDCEDGSDELDCHKCQTTLSCQASNNMQTGRKFCLIGAHLCDNQTHCPSGEDETTYCQSECKEGHYKCRDMDMCIPDEAVCDGEEHCPYGDDEENCNGKCKNGAKFCDDKICVSKRKLCDGTADCQDKRDEEDCDCASCSGKNSVLCDGNEKLCTSKYRVCDGKKDCPAGEDEEGCPGVCPLMHPLTDDIDFVQKKIANNELIRCADGEIYEWKEACNGLNQHCRHSCTKCNPEMAFQCGSETIHRVGNLTIIGAEVNETDIDEKRIPEAKMKIHNTLKECIHRSLVCDRKRDCSDGSDELNCFCGPNSMKCQPHSEHITTNHCFLDTQKCDGYTDCVGGEDERDCDVCKNGAFHCSSEKRCIPSSARCDGKEDCTDKSDEENCTCEECSSHSTKMYMCSGSARCFPLQKVCSPYTMCPNATKMDKLFCAVRGKEYF